MNIMNTEKAQRVTEELDEIIKPHFSREKIGTLPI